MESIEISSLASLEKDIRRKDDQIRMLSQEVMDLTKHRDILREQVEQWQLKLNKIQEAHSVLDEVITSKHKEIDDKRTSVMEDLKYQKDILDTQKEDQAKKSSELISREDDLNANKESLNILKKESIEHIKSLIGNINSEIEEFVDLFEKA